MYNYYIIIIAASFLLNFILLLFLAYYRSRHFNQKNAINKRDHEEVVNLLLLSNSRQFILFKDAIISLVERGKFTRINYQSDLNKIINNSLNDIKKNQSKIIEEQSILKTNKQCCKSTLTDIECLVFYLSESGLKPNSIADILCSTPERIRACRSRINKKVTDYDVQSNPHLPDE